MEKGQKGILRMKTTLYVDGIACNKCAQMIKAELLEMDGVKNVDIILENGKVEIEQNNQNIEQMKKAIQNLGYEVK